jgi:hypothetical protein
MIGIRNSRDMVPGKLFLPVRNQYKKKGDCGKMKEPVELFHFFTSKKNSSS